AVRKILNEVRRRLEREARLSHPTRTRKRDETDTVDTNRTQNVAELFLPADQRLRRQRKIRRVQRLEWRKVAVAELVNPFRGRQILEPVLTEIAQLVRVGKVAGRLREQDLSTVTSRCNASGAVDVDSDIALRSDERFPRV